MLKVRLLLLMGCLLTSVVRSLAAQELLCDASKMADTLISVRRHKNQTGHWISQVSLKDAPHKEESTTWAVDISHVTTRCEGSRAARDFVFTFTSRPEKPGPSYELFPDMGYYKFHTDVTTWPRAREICAEEGGHLMIINSEKEADIVRQLFARHPVIKGTPHNDWAWLGYQKIPGLEGFRTIFGDLLNSTGYETWHPNHHNELPADDCMLVHRSSAGLNDFGGNYNDAFICEQELW